MSPQDALQILDLATRPQHAGQLTRADYGNIELALQCLRARVHPPAAEPAASLAAEPADSPADSPAAP